MKQDRIKLINNGRFYVLSGSILLSLMIFFGLQIIIPDSRLRNIRLEQIYGLLALLYWYFVLLLSPLSKLMPKSPTMAAVLFNRRPLGVLVAYFASLHAGITFFDQLDGWHGIGLLPISFKVSLILGVLTLLVLLFMSLLSVDIFVKLIHFSGWKIISRISYLAGITTIIHVWMIGSHVTLNLLQLFVFESLVLLFGLEAWRLGAQLIKNGGHKPASAVYAVAIWLALSLGLIAMKLYIPSYSKVHSEHQVINGVIVHEHH